MHRVAPTSVEENPTAHAVHPAAAVSPLKVPAPHDVQPLVPTDTKLYLPAMQAVQANVFKGTVL